MTSILEWGCLFLTSSWAIIIKEKADPKRILYYNVKNTIECRTVRVQIKVPRNNRPNANAIPRGRLPYVTCDQYVSIAQRWRRCT